jgi:hypothetical protein
VAAIVPDEVPVTAMTEGVRGYAVDPKSAEALWKKSEEMVGECAIGFPHGEVSTLSR